MPKPFPILEAFAHLHTRNLTIDRLYTTQAPNAAPKTHVTTKPRPTQEPIAPKPHRPAPTCTICHKPKDDPAHATCLSVACLKVFFGKK